MKRAEALRQTAGRHPALSKPNGLPSIPVDVGEGPLVLFVHGQPGNGRNWWPVAEALSPGFHLVAPDRPGWGAHPRPATGLRGNALVLARMLEDRELLRKGERAVVVGHSLGGGVALELALGRPDLVGALVLVSSVGVAGALTGIDRLLAVPLVGDGALRAGAVVIRRGVRAARRLSRAGAVEAVLEQASRFPAVRAIMAEGDHPMDGRGRRSFLVEQRALIQETPAIEDRLPSLRLPTIVIHGTADHIVSVGAARDLAEAIPGAELHLEPGSGHLLPFEQPEVVAAGVRRYSSLAGLLTDEGQSGVGPERGSPNGLSQPSDLPEAGSKK